MTLTFSEARQAGMAFMADAWEGDEPLEFATEGLQDDAAYLIDYGPAKWMRERNPDDAPLGLKAMLVDKETGEVWFDVWPAIIQRVDAMEPAE